MEDNFVLKLVASLRGRSALDTASCTGGCGWGTPLPCLNGRLNDVWPSARSLRQWAIFSALWPLAPTGLSCGTLFLLSRTALKDSHSEPATANRQPLFNTASVALCLVHVLTMKQRAAP